MLQMTDMIDRYVYLLLDVNEIQSNKSYVSPKYKKTFKPLNLNFFKLAAYKHECCVLWDNTSLDFLK